MKVYRVRRGLFGKSILQVIVNHPSLIGGQVDSSTRDIYWDDVPYDRAPSELTDFPPDLKEILGA